ETKPAPPAEPTTAPSGETPPKPPLTPEQVSKIRSRNNITYKAERISRLIGGAGAASQPAKGAAAANVETLPERALQLSVSAPEPAKEAPTAAAAAVAELNKTISAHPNSPDVPTWRNIAEVFAPAPFDLQLASIDVKIAQTHADRAMGIDLRDKIR